MFPNPINLVEAPIQAKQVRGNDVARGLVSVVPSCFQALGQGRYMVVETTGLRRGAMLVRHHARKQAGSGGQRPTSGGTGCRKLDAMLVEIRQWHVLPIH